VGTSGHERIESLVLEEVEVPDPGTYETQIRLHAASLNFRDWNVSSVSKTRGSSCILLSE